MKSEAKTSPLSFWQLLLREGHPQRRGCVGPSHSVSSCRHRACLVAEGGESVVGK